jgi:hypothetical protein
MAVEKWSPQEQRAREKALLAQPSKRWYTVRVFILREQCGMTLKSQIIERPLLVNGYASRSGFIGNSSFPTQRENSYQSYNSLYRTINALNRQRTYNISQLSKMVQLNEVFSIRSYCAIHQRESEQRQLSKSETQFCWHPSVGSQDRRLKRTAVIRED